MSAHEVHSGCRSCGADIVFVPSAKSGKSMILNAKPEKRVVCLIGDVDFEAENGVGIAGVIGNANDVALYDAKAAVVSTYIDHHATCPNAEDWKGKSR